MDAPALTILDSLQQSRQALLHHAFSLFSAPSRPKTVQKIIQPPHTLRHFQTATVTIGPHSFADTKLFLAEWNTAAGAAVPPPPPPVAQPAPAPASTGITPALIKRLNAASLTDPALAALLRRAANGEATPQELTGLARHIEELRKEEDAANPPAPIASTSQPPASAGPIAHPALVIEFAESAGDRFIIPDHYVVTPLPLHPAHAAHPPTPSTLTCNALLSFFIFPPDRSKGKQPAGAAPPTANPVPVDLIVEQCTEQHRECLFKASRVSRPRDERVEMWWRQMINAVPARVHVIYQPPRLPTPPPDPSFPGSAALSRTGSELAPTSTIPAKRGGTPASGPAKKKAPARKKAAPRPSARSKASSVALSTTGTAEPSPSPGPSSVAGSPAPSERGGGTRKRPPAKRRATGGGRASGRGKTKDDDDEGVEGSVEPGVKVEGVDVEMS
ncbi:hypothetical protein JCM5296_005868 [Sporobolomyces johnsonii]